MTSAGDTHLPAAKQSFTADQPDIIPYRKPVLTDHISS
jgi:hypothetical protein